MIIVSACLIGIKCRYDGKINRPCKKVIELLKKRQAIPVCPEQLGGLPTPRIAAERKKDRVFLKNGRDVTINFKEGAKEAIRIAKLSGAKKAILKARSPSCGSGEIYDGSFTNTLISGDGVFTEICKKEGIQVFTEEEI
ncbi:MAG: DUF523 domain-containing protein [Patescibacteria group bacterium]|nr:DUF523 domain-containing protein [Patescibacteria group bacterium]